MKSEAYLVGTNEAQAQGRQHLDDCGAAVAPDWVVGLQLWHYVLPTHVLPHQGTKVAHHKRTLLHLGTQDDGDNHSEYTEKLVKPLQALLSDD